MEKHNIKSELESCHDIYRNYLKKTQNLPKPIEGYNPTDRSEWVAAKRAAKFYSRKTSREVKKARQALIGMVPTHYKFNRLDQHRQLLELKLEFILTVQAAIEVARTEQSAFVEKELLIAKENVLKGVSSSEDGGSKGKDVDTISATSKSSQSTTIYGENTSRPPKRKDASDSSNDDTLTSDEHHLKPPTDADFEFEALYANQGSANNSRNYTDADIEELNRNAGLLNPEVKPTVPAMNNPLRATKSFHSSNKSSDISVNKTSGGQLANKIHQQEPKNLLNRSMHSIRLEEERDSLEHKPSMEHKPSQSPAASPLQSRSVDSLFADSKTDNHKEGLRPEAANVRTVINEKAMELSTPEKHADDEKKEKGKNPIKSIGKAIGKMFAFSSTTSSAPAAATTNSPRPAPATNASLSKSTSLDEYQRPKTPQPPKPPQQFYGKPKTPQTPQTPTNAKPVAAASPVAAAASPKAAAPAPAAAAAPEKQSSFSKLAAAVSFNFKANSHSSDDFDNKVPAQSAPKVTAANPDHIINTTSSFAEARRIAKQQQYTKEKNKNQPIRNEHVAAVIQNKAGEIDSMRVENNQPSAAAASITSPPNKPQQHTFESSPPVSALAQRQQMIQKEQQMTQQQPQPQPGRPSYQPQFNNSLAGGHHPAIPQASFVPPAITSQVPDPALQPGSRGSIDLMRNERDNNEKLMKVSDDLVNQAKATENKYNTMPDQWFRVTQAWEECVTYCEKQYDGASERFRNDWNRKLMYVIKEKHRWNEKMKRLNEYDYLHDGTRTTSNVAAINNGANVSDISLNSRNTSTNSMANKSYTPSSSYAGGVPNYSRPMSTTSTSNMTKTQSMYEYSSSRNTSANYSNPNAPTTAQQQQQQQTSPPTSNYYQTAAEPNKVEKLQDKLQRNKVKSLIEKALIVTNTAKYQQSKKAIQEAKQAWLDALNVYEQSYHAAPLAFKDWWSQEIENVKRQRDENLSTLMEKSHGTSMYNITVDGALANSSHNHNNNNGQSAAPVVSNPNSNPNVPNMSANYSSVILTAADKQDRSYRKGGDLQIGVQFEGDQPSSPGPGGNSSSEPNYSQASYNSGVSSNTNSTANNPARNSVNFHRVRVG